MILKQKYITINLKIKSVTIFSRQVIIFMKYNLYTERPILFFWNGRLDNKTKLAAY